MHIMFEKTITMLIISCMLMYELQLKSINYSNKVTVTLPWDTHMFINIKQAWQ